MSVKKNGKAFFALTLSLFVVKIYGAVPPDTSRQPHTAVPNMLTSAPPDSSPVSPAHMPTLKEQLGWVETHANLCGGYYLDEPFTFPTSGLDTIETVGDQGVFSFRGTSILEGRVTISRKDQQITTSKATLYRDPETGKITSVDLIGNVHLREPNTLVVARSGRYDFSSNHKALTDIYYRSLLTNKQIKAVKPKQEELQKAREISTLTAWGKASQLIQNQPKVFELHNATYSTCPPIDPAWHVKASHIVLNKQTGRGYATHARIYIKNVPVLYAPYINFPIDHQRKTGFLWPKFGNSSTWGPYLLTPYYWNMAPNYDMTLTPGILSERGLQLTDNFRYLSHINRGELNLSVLTHDRHFADFKKSVQESANDPESFKKYLKTTNSVNIANAEIARLEKSSPTRAGFFWRDNSQFTDHWSSHLDFNYATDDYYLRDFGSSLNEITQNQLLQEGDVYYKSENWNFTGRLQAYETLHPLTSPNVLNQYRRLPQLVLNGDYPDQAFGLEYFINNDLTHFDFLKTPGVNNIPAIGNRFHIQPGISLPLYWTSFFITPRIQFALTQYNLTGNSLAAHQVVFTPVDLPPGKDKQLPNNITRALPIFDISSGFSLDRNISIFSRSFQQTLEPQIYYTYIPYHNQDNIPIFDTTVNTLVYDQVFNYNRYTGIDRIGDANQLALGLTSRFIDSDSGFEKIRFGIGDIVYFADRRVTLCQNKAQCTNYPDNPANKSRLSPVSSMLSYYVNTAWSITNNNLWSPYKNQIDMSSFAFHYQPDPNRVINLGYSFVRNGDPFTGINTNTSENNLQLTDISVAWPIIENLEWLGRWTEDWNSNHFLNMLFGIQYDSCCWAVRAVAGRTFQNLKNNKPEYNKEFYIQIALKGFGDAGTGDSTKLLSGITGYNTKFGQDL